MASTQASIGAMLSMSTTGTTATDAGDEAAGKARESVKAAGAGESEAKPIVE